MRQNPSSDFDLTKPRSISGTHLATVRADLDMRGFFVVAEVPRARRVRAIATVVPVVAVAITIEAVSVEGAI